MQSGFFGTSASRYDCRVESLVRLRTLALDVGDRRIGIAISDRLGLTVQGRPTLTRRDIDSDMAHILGLIEEEDVERIVIGLPLHLDGRASPQSLKTQAFAEQLETVAGVAVVLWDERLTSFAAEQELEEMGMTWQKRRGRVDEMAATLILEDFLKENE